MHIKHMHEMIEKLTDCTKTAIENDQVCVGQYPIGDVVDMIKDLNEASYYASIVKAMEEAKKEEEEEEKHMLRMLKGEHKDEYKRYMDEYGEDGERRFYDNYRYKTTGRYAPKGKGTYVGRRGYEEPPYYHMNPDYRMDLADYKGKTAEELRDLDRSRGKLYFSEPMGDMTRDGMRDAREGRSGEKRRGYMETKEMHKDNSPESKQKRMKELDVYMNELNEDMKELIADMTPEERAIVKQKVAKLATLV